MDGSSPDELKKRKRELNAALAETNRELKVAKRRVKNEQRKEDTHWKLSTVLVHTLLIIVQLADTPAAVKYLINFGKRRHWPERPETDISKTIVDLFLEVDAEELACLSDKVDPQDADAMRAALPYVEEWHVKQWATGLNEQHGLAPSARAVLQHLEERRARIPETVRPRYVGNVAESRARLSLHRFRRRWGGRHGKVPVCDLVPLPELRSKAAQKKHRTHRKNKADVYFLGSDSGTSFGSNLGRFGGSFQGPGLNPQGPFLVPILGTKFGSHHGDQIWFPQLKT